MVEVFVPDVNEKSKNYVDISTAAPFSDVLVFRLSDMRLLRKESPNGEILEVYGE